MGTFTGTSDKFRGSEGEPLPAVALSDADAPNLIIGTDEGETLTGTEGDDIIEGLGGHDELFGNDGNDILRGGDTWDRLEGGDGDDILEGGADSDTLSDDAGSDVLRGEDGRDYFYIFRSDRGVTEQIRVEGGADEDWLTYLNYNASELTADMGSGDDYIQLYAYAGPTRITLGSGVDTLDFDERFRGQPGPMTITDFVPGDLGDRIEWNAFLANYLLDWDLNSNPFSTGHLRLVQQDADTLLQIDRDGGGNDYSALITFEATNAIEFTYANFDGYPPDGGQIPGAVIFGRDDDHSERLEGTVGDDVIEGLRGPDSLYGESGNDMLRGGAGIDVIHGGAGDDVIEGGDDADSISDTVEGSDVLRGDGGNDEIIVTHLDRGLVEQILVEGGTGNDRLAYNNGNSSELTIDMGSGDDVVRLLGLTGSALITFGDGVDTVELPENSDNLQASITLTDFSPGASGDRIEWTGFLDSYFAYFQRSENPFATGRLRLVQQGADTLLQADRDGGGNSYSTLITFQGTIATDFTHENFDGYPPDGGEIPGVRIVGTDAGETLMGTSGADLIEGLGGDDLIFGQGSRDIIRGGAGNDQLFGFSGNDVLEGGDGDDILQGQTGSDTLRGDGGNDLFEVTVGSEGGQVRVEGGDGNDQLTYRNFGDGLLSADMGSGIDTILLYTRGGMATLTLGSGADTLELDQQNYMAGHIVVTDFEPGALGDRIEWSSFLDAYLVMWDGSSNPFSADFLRLVQQGADTLVQVRADNGYGDFTTIVTFQNVSASALTADNSDGYAPTAPIANGTDAGEVIEGTADDDHILGFAGNDSLFGLAGSDRLEGGAGDDRIEAGQGDDILLGGRGADVMLGGEGSDIYEVNEAGDVVSEQANEGSDSVFAYADFALSGDVENLYMHYGSQTHGTGNASDNLIIGNSYANIIEGLGGADIIDGEAGNDRLDGGAGNDRLDGGDGNDVLLGGFGADVMIGGAGSDAYEVDNIGDVVLEQVDQGIADNVFAYVDFALGENLDNLLMNYGLQTYGFGNSGDNIIVGNARANVIEGRAGYDTMTGGAGSDLFIINPNYGVDVITDFEVGAGSEDALIFAQSLFTNFDQVMANAAQVGADTWIGDGLGNTIVLSGVQIGTLHPNDFGFF